MVISSGDFSNAHLSFARKRAFSLLLLIFSRKRLPQWVWHLDILKVLSICNRMVYNTSIYDKNWSVQIFFTKKYQLSHIGRSSLFEPCHKLTWANTKNPCAGKPGLQNQSNVDITMTQWMLAISLTILLFKIEFDTRDPS